MFLTNLIHMAAVGCKATIQINYVHFKIRQRTFCTVHTFDNRLATYGKHKMLSYATPSKTAVFSWKRGDCVETALCAGIIFATLYAFLLIKLSVEFDVSVLPTSQLSIENTYLPENTHHRLRLDKLQYK